MSIAVSFPPPPLLFSSSLPLPLSLSSSSSFLLLLLLLSPPPSSPFSSLPSSLLVSLLLPFSLFSPYLLFLSSSSFSPSWYPLYPGGCDAQEKEGVQEYPTCPAASNPAGEDVEPLLRWMQTEFSTVKSTVLLSISTKAGVHCLLPHAGNTSPAGTATEAAVVGAFRRSGSLHSTMIVITEVYRCAVGKLSRCCELLSSLQLELPIFFRFVINAMRTGMDISAAGRHWQLFRVQAARFFTDDSSLV